MKPLPGTTPEMAHAQGVQVALAPPIWPVAGSSATIDRVAVAAWHCRSRIRTIRLRIARTKCQIYPPSAIWTITMLPQLVTRLCQFGWSARIADGSTVHLIETSNNFTYEYMVEISNSSRSSKKSFGTIECRAVARAGKLHELGVGFWCVVNGVISTAYRPTANSECFSNAEHTWEEYADNEHSKVDEPPLRSVFNPTRSPTAPAGVRCTKRSAGIEVTVFLARCS